MAAAPTLADGIGARLAAARRQAGLSQAAAAARAGTDAAAWCRWERGARLPSLRLLVAAAAACGVAPAELMPTQEPPDA